MAKARSMAKAYSQGRVCSLNCTNKILNRNKSGVCTRCWNSNPDEAWRQWERAIAIARGQGLLWALR